MKIQLERNPRSGSVGLNCAVCDQNFRAHSLRTLLCHDRGDIVGDICSTCLWQPIDRLQQQLRQRAARTIDRPLAAEDEGTPSPHKLALELTELAHQQLAIPPFYVWWWKRLTILTAETRELEAARTGKNCQSQRSPRLEIKFLNEEPSSKE